MTLDSLVLSRDLNLVRIIRPTLEKLTIDVRVCQEAAAATKILVSEKFDGVVVDCDDLKGGLQILQDLRKTPSNKYSVAFAVLNGKQTTTQEAFGMGANFVLQKPISALNASRCFNAAFNFMLRERRRYFRQPVEMPVQLAHEQNNFEAQCTDISEGGMAIKIQKALPKSAMLAVKFRLPDTSAPLELAAETAWIDSSGRAGLRFHHVPQPTQEQLERWLDDHMERNFPGAKERLAAAESDSSD